MNRQSLYILMALCGLIIVSFVAVASTALVFFAKDGLVVLSLKDEDITVRVGEQPAASILADQANDVRAYNDIQEQKPNQLNNGTVLSEAQPQTASAATQQLDDQSPTPAEQPALANEDSGLDPTQTQNNETAANNQNQMPTEQATTVEANSPSEETSSTNNPSSSNSDSTGQPPMEFNSRQFSPEDVTVGEVTAINGTTFTLRTMQGDEITVLTDDTTAYRGRGQNVSFAGIEIGRRVIVDGDEVEGQANTMQANTIGFAPR